MALVLLTLSGLVATAQAFARPSSNPLLWATVNTCDTARHPNAIGIRGSMPGTMKGREVMFMRFRAQYLSVEDDKWHNVPHNGDTGFLEVGRANVKARQEGRWFPIKPKTDSTLLRGVVTFHWRREGKVVRRAQQRTRKGHTSKAGADPAGYSATYCTIKR